MYDFLAVVQFKTNTKHTVLNKPKHKKWCFLSAGTHCISGQFS